MPPTSESSLRPSWLSTRGTPETHRVIQERLARNAAAEITQAELEAVVAMDRMLDRGDPAVGELFREVIRQHPAGTPIGAFAGDYLGHRAQLDAIDEIRTAPTREGAGYGAYIFVSSTDAGAAYWQKRFEKGRGQVLPKDAIILSVSESNWKDANGASNGFGTLNAWHLAMEVFSSSDFQRKYGGAIRKRLGHDAITLMEVCREQGVIMMHMAGKGTRMQPLAADNKSAIKLPGRITIDGRPETLTVGEAVIMNFALNVRRCRLTLAWGDQNNIPSLPIGSNDTHLVEIFGIQVPSTEKDFIEQKGTFERTGLGDGGEIRVRNWEKLPIEKVKSYDGMVDTSLGFNSFRWELLDAILSEFDQELTNAGDRQARPDLLSALNIDSELWGPFTSTKSEYEEFIRNRATIEARKKSKSVAPKGAPFDAEGYVRRQVQWAVGHWERVNRAFDRATLRARETTPEIGARDQNGIGFLQEINYGVKDRSSDWLDWGQMSDYYATLMALVGKPKDYAQIWRQERISRFFGLPQRSEWTNEASLGEAVTVTDALVMNSSATKGKIVNSIVIDTLAEELDLEGTVAINNIVHGLTAQGNNIVTDVVEGHEEITLAPGDILSAHYPGRQVRIRENFSNDIGDDYAKRVGNNEVSAKELSLALKPFSALARRTARALDIARAVFPAAALRARSKKPENLTNAIHHLSEWLTRDRFYDYREALLDLIDIAAADKAVADELYDSFYRVMPFGTGGRRSKVGIGPNRMNAYMAAMTAQGDAKFIINEQGKKGAPVADSDLFVGAWDVREFHKYFAETPALERYREVIDAKCPALSGLSSEDLSEIAALVYAGNDIRYVHPCAMRPTPWLSFLINAWGRIAADRPFSDEAAILNRCRRVLGGIVLSSSHNPYDNNGTKFYETSGAQTPPHIVDVLQRIGDEVRDIKYFGGDCYYKEGRKAAFDAARKSGMVVVLDEKNLGEVDHFYIQNSIDELKSLYSSQEWEGLTTPCNPNDPQSSLIGQLTVSFNALNGTGAVGLLKVLESVGFSVLRSPEDTPTWEFTEGYGNVPNPEAEKTFNSGMQIGIRRTLTALIEGDLRGLATILNLVDEDGKAVPHTTFSSGRTADEVIRLVRTATGKHIRGIELVPAATDETTIARLKDHVLRNNICLLTDPDADRVGLGMQTFRFSPDRDVVQFHWISANDNDESGIVLFRYRLDQMLKMAERGELIQFIEDRRLEDGNPATPGQNHQLVVVNTVVSNPLEAVIAERISKGIEEWTRGRVSVKVLTHHVGFKFTGEIIDNIKLGNAGRPFEGITGELMTKAGINGKDAFFVMSSEEGEGSLIGCRGSIDKDSGVTGLALALLAAEQLGRGMTLHDYLLETYDRYGYSKASLEPMVMTGEYGMTMINDHIMGYLRDGLLPAVRSGQRCEWRLPGSAEALVFTGGTDHLDLMKKLPDENPDSWTATKQGLPGDPAQWPIAIRESINILEFSCELASEQRVPKEQRTRIVIVMRPSGTEPKHKNMVKIVAQPRDPAEERIEEYIDRIDKLSRMALDAAMIASYDASLVEYDSRVVEEPGKQSFLELSPEDRVELLRIFPIIVSAEAKLAIYFPLRTHLQKEAARLVKLSGSDFWKAYAPVRKKTWDTAPDGSTKGYLTNFNKTNGIEFIEESVRMNLARQIAAWTPGDPKVAEVFVQALLWFGPELGRITFEALLSGSLSEAPGSRGQNDSAIHAEVGKVMERLLDSYHSRTTGDRP